MEPNKWRFGRGCSFSCWGDSQVSSLEKNSSPNLVMSIGQWSMSSGLRRCGVEDDWIVVTFWNLRSVNERFVIFAWMFLIYWMGSLPQRTFINVNPGKRKATSLQPSSSICLAPKSWWPRFFLWKSTTKLMFSMMRMASVSWYCPATNHDVLSPLLIWWMMDTAGIQTMEYILPMPSTKNRGSGKWPFLEVYTLSKPNHLPLKRGLPPPKKIFQLPLFRGKVLVLGNVPKVGHFSLPMIPSPRLRRCVYHSLEAAYCIGVLPLRPTAVVFGANMTKAWQKRLPL